MFHDWGQDSFDFGDKFVDFYDVELSSAAASVLRAVRTECSLIRASHRRGLSQSTEIKTNVKLSKFRLSFKFKALS